MRRFPVGTVPAQRPKSLIGTIVLRQNDRVGGMSGRCYPAGTDERALQSNDHEDVPGGAGTRRIRGVRDDACRVRSLAKPRLD